MEKQHAGNPCNHPDRPVAPGARDVLHHGRTDPCPAGHRDRRHRGPCHTRPTRVGVPGERTHAPFEHRPESLTSFSFVTSVTCAMNPTTSPSMASGTYVARLCRLTPSGPGTTRSKSCSFPFSAARM